MSLPEIMGLLRQEKMFVLFDCVEGVQGGKLNFILYIIDEDGRPVDTTVYDSFRIGIKLDSSSALEVSQVASANGSIMTKLGDPVLGAFNVAMTPDDSALLPDKERQDIEFEMAVIATPTDTVRLVVQDKLSIAKTILS